MPAVGNVVHRRETRPGARPREEASRSRSGSRNSRPGRPTVRRISNRNSGNASIRSTICSMPAGSWSGRAARTTYIPPPAGITSSASTRFRSGHTAWRSWRMSRPRMMTGTMDAPEARYIVYQGEKNGDDHFRADVPFEVTCPCRNEFEAVLQRVHGITRFRFENIPARIASVEVVLDNVGQRMPLCGEPDLACEVSKRIPAAQLRTRPAGSFTLGTFCTLPGVRTSWRLRLYGEDDAPLYDRVVTDTLRIECNQLIDLTARFEEGDFRGEIEFSVDVDTTMGRSQRRRGRNHTMTRSMFPARPSRAAGALCLPWKRHGRTPADGRRTEFPGRDAPAADFISTGSRSAARSFRAHPLPSSAGSGRPVAWNRSPAPSCADRPPLRLSIRKGGRSARTRPAV